MSGLGFRIRERRLENGLLVLAAERRAHPVVSAMIWYSVGSRDERTSETGLSHFLEHMMFKGTRRLAKGEIDLLTARLGGSNNAFTDYDCTAYYFNFARDRWEAAFAVEAERMRGCRLDPGEFAREKKVVLEEMRMGDDDPWRDLAESVGSAVFQVHPYHHPVIGWKTDLEALTRERMAAFYRAHYAPERAIVVVAGDVSADEVFAAARRHFAKIPRCGRPRDAAPAEPAQRGERRLRIERDTNIRRLMVGFRGVAFDDRRDHALDLLAAALTTGRASRLRKKLVKERRLATHVSIENEARIDPGVLWASVEAVEGVGETELEEALFDELRKVASRGIAARELARARRMIVAGLAMGRESAAEVADRVGRMAILGDWRYATRYLDRIARVTAREVREAAAAILDPARRTVGWCAPRGAGNGDPKKNGAGHGDPKKNGARSWKLAAGRRIAVEPPPRTIRFALPPRRGAAPVVRLPFLREVLPNGLTVLVTRNDAAPTVAVNAFVDVPASCEPEELAGIEHLTGSCLEEGSRRRSGDAIADSVEELGGYLESGSRGVHASGLAEGLPTILETTADILAHPTFPADAFERVRDEIVTDLLGDEDDLRTRAFRRLRELVYGRHPLHRPAEGYLATVRKLRRADAVAFHDRWYSPARTILAVAGGIDPKEAARLARRAFGAWRAPAREHPPFPPVPRPRAARARVVLPREQVHIAMGHAGIRRTDPDYEALLVLDHVLGTGPGFTDRISRRIRDELGLAYGVSANITASAGKEPGLFAAYLSTEPKNAKLARVSLAKEIRRVLETPPTTEEVRTAKDYLIGSYPFALERNSHRAHALIQMERYGLGARAFENYPARIEAVTPADVARAARAHLRPQDCAVVEVGAK